MKFLASGTINNIPALVQIMARRRTIIWTNDGLFSGAYMIFGLNLIDKTIEQYTDNLAMLYVRYGQFKHV